MRPESRFRIAPNWPYIRKMAMTPQFADMTSSSNFFDAVLSLLPSLVTGPIFMSISSLVLKLWQFSFIRDWPEMRKSEILPSEFCPISGDWGKLGMWLNAAKRQGYSFYCFWVIKQKNKHFKWKTCWVKSTIAIKFIYHYGKAVLTPFYKHPPPTPPPLYAAFPYREFIKMLNRFCLGIFSKHLFSYDFQGS